MGRTIPRLTAVAALLVSSQALAAVPLEEALEAYPEGLRTGDLRTLESIFFSDGQFCRAVRSEIRCSSFSEALPSWIEEPDPKTRGKIISKEIVGDSMARVTYELSFNGALYIDYLLLYQKAGRWLVVAKTTFIEE